MPTVILLSSSPPRVFARSPTPVSSSQAFSCTNNRQASESPARKRFKSDCNSRHGFHSGFRSARQVLGEKHGDANKFICSPARNKFLSSQGEHSEYSEQEIILEEAVSCSGRVEPLQADTDKTRQGTEAKILHTIDSRRKKAPASSPLFLERAVARRIDWTPPKASAIIDVDTPEETEQSTFPGNLFGSFGYQRPGVQSGREDASISSALAPKEGEDTPICGRKALDISKATDASVVNPRVGRTKAKTTAKKALTITGLATSNFLGHTKPTEPPVKQYLSTIQTSLPSDALQSESLENRVRKTQAAVKKLKESKKKPVQSRLVSPLSALRTLEEQDAIFGSASQLVRNKPTAKRDSDVFNLSDPFPSSPLAQPPSVEATPPQVGTARFRASRNLWASAGRDADNALLHINELDPQDSPLIRIAFTGKEVMVQPAIDRSTTKAPQPLSMNGLSVVSQHRPSIIDIDDVVTPGKVSSSTRDFHQSLQADQPRKKGDLTDKDSHITSQPKGQKRAASKAKKPPVKKPHYAGLSDHDLKKQISAYGFKSIKKREKMIELLDKCWSEKFGTASLTNEPVSQNPAYGDILSNVHAVSARPIPKPPKVPRPRKKKDEGEIEIDKSVPVKKPRQRRKKGGESEHAATVKTPSRKRKSLAEVTTIEQACDTGVLEGATTVDDSVGSETVPGLLKSSKKTKSTTVTTSEPHLLALPLAHPESSPEVPLLLTSALRTTDALNLQRNLPDAVPTPDVNNPQPDIFQQITQAINHQSFTSNVHLTTPSKPKTALGDASGTVTEHRNHQTNPTWHEKILLYDPIILEDLAVWLNTEGLGRIGEDREVSAIEVRSWCESRGICCLWKGGWRGQKNGD